MSYTTLESGYRGLSDSENENLFPLRAGGFGFFVGDDENSDDMTGRVIQKYLLLII